MAKKGISKAERERIEKEELLALLRERDRRQKECPLDFYNRPPKVHQKQIDFHSQPHRIKAAFGGNRTGKTVSGAVEAIWHATGLHPFLDLQPEDGWVVSVSNEVQRDVAQKEILRWLPKSWIAETKMREGKQTDPESGIIDFLVLKPEYGGKRIGFKSCDQGRAKFQGTSQGWVWFDEEPPEDIYKECKMRVLDKDGYMWFTMTPLMGLTWVYDVIYLNEINDPEVWYTTFAWEDNPWLSERVIKHLIATMPEDEREARQYGRFVALAGLVYKKYREEIHFIDPFPVPHEWYDKISIDPGFTAPLSCHFYARSPDGTVYAIAEHYKAGMTVEHHAREIWRIARELGWKTNRKGHLVVQMDVAATQKTLAGEETVEELFKQYGIVAKFPPKDVWTGIQWCKWYIEPREHPNKAEFPNGKPKFFVFKTCPEMNKEFKSYRWETPKDNKNAPEAPRKYKDHAMDDFRYYIRSGPSPFEQTENVIKGIWTRGELKMKGYSDRQINRFIRQGLIKLIGR